MHTSPLLATRMTIDEMLPILKTMDEVGYFSVECWGGATFDSCIRFLDEDPWERLRTLRREMPNTKLQMLFRGRTCWATATMPTTRWSIFVQKSVANGIDILRIFDALNDPPQPADRHQGGPQGEGPCASLHQLTP